MVDSTKKILVALDGSRASLDMVAYLAHVLPASGVFVNLFSVTTGRPESFWDLQQEPAPDPLDLWVKRRRRSLVEFMELSRKVFLDSGFDEENVKIKIADRVIGIARDIIREAEKGYDAVAVGRVGMNPITRLVIGSVANKIVDSVTDIPVWLIAKSMKSKRFLVAMDASGGAMRCVEHAGEMLAETDAEFTLFHVLRDYDLKLLEYENDIVTEMENTRWFKITEEQLGKARHTMHRAMLEARDRLEKMGVSTARITTKILSGMATRGGSIAAQALLGGYGTIVIGRRGLSEVGEFSMGRVCHKVVQLANDTAVWVIP